jgi:hypothetical protein
VTETHHPRSLEISASSCASVCNIIDLGLSEASSLSPHGFAIWLCYAICVCEAFTDSAKWMIDAVSTFQDKMWNTVLTWHCLTGIFMNRYYVMRNNVVQTILRLTHRREKYLVVAAVRFLRTCIALKVGFFPTNMTSTFSLMWSQSW